MKLIKTYKFRIKDSVSHKWLNRMSVSVNFVWNYCNDVSFISIRNKSKWLSDYDLINLTSGCSKELGISSVTIQSVCSEYTNRRIKARKTKLNWRSKKRSLGWIPFKSNAVNINNDIIKYNGHVFRFWKSQDITGKIKTGNFSQDARGRWYVNIQCEIEKQELPKTGCSIGIDLGLKTIATDSNGVKYERENLTKKYEDKLAIAQRASKKRLALTLHAKIKNKRRDWANKITTEIVKNNDVVFVGDVSSSKLKKTRMAKSVSDAGWGQLKSLLEYKAIRFGREYKEVKENFSTVTCHICLCKNNIGGLSNLGVRGWKCDVCGTIHDRDTNAARNILRFGHESPKGILVNKEMMSNNNAKG